MHCNQCGAGVPADSKFCPGCGRPLGSVQPSRRQETEPHTRQLFIFLAIIFGLLILASAAGTLSDEDNSTTVGNETTSTFAGVQPGDAATEARGKACDDAIDNLRTTGLVKDRPSPNRVDVEELNWAALAAKDKRLVAAGVRCSFLKGRESDRTEDYGVVYGYRSGKRLAMATSTGVELE